MKPMLFIFLFTALIQGCGDDDLAPQRTLTEGDWVDTDCTFGSIRYRFTEDHKYAVEIKRFREGCETESYKSVEHGHYSKQKIKEHTYLVSTVPSHQEVVAYTKEGLESLIQQDYLIEGSKLNKVYLRRAPLNTDLVQKVFKVDRSTLTIVASEREAEFGWPPPDYSAYPLKAEELHKEFPAYKFQKRSKDLELKLFRVSPYSGYWASNCLTDAIEFHGTKISIKESWEISNSENHEYTRLLYFYDGKKCQRSKEIAHFRIQGNLQSLEEGRKSLRPLTVASDYHPGEMTVESSAYGSITDNIVETLLKWEGYFLNRYSETSGKFRVNRKIPSANEIGHFSLKYLLSRETHDLDLELQDDTLILGGEMKLKRRW
jgi:hypothetical protein